MSNDFTELLQASRQQPQPQRLLFVFVRVELPDTATAAQRLAFEQGQGGTLTPALAVDKLPEEVASFQALVEESGNTGVPWDLLFVAGLDGQAGHAPNSDQAVQPLKLMLKAINSGRIAQFAAFDRAGERVVFA
jgi:hypothetical protein